MQEALWSAYRLRSGRGKPKLQREAYVNPSTTSGSLLDASLILDAVHSRSMSSRRYIVDVFHTIAYRSK
jgi:hypothetical protein